MNLVSEQVRIENPDNAIDFFIEKPKNVIQNGITTPPPPIPAIVLRAIIIGKIINPANSDPHIGKMCL